MKAGRIVFMLLVVGLISCNKPVEDPNPQLTDEVKKIDDYLASSGLAADSWRDNSTGISFVVHNTGQDIPPRQGQTVLLHYQGRTFPDGAVFTTGQFTDSYEKIAPEGLRYSVGALLGGMEATFYIPSQYAFGQTGAAGVPPNTTVVYDVYLEKVNKTSTVQTRFEIDTATIHKFIKDNNISNAVQHPSGLWYTIDEPGGTGNYPTPYHTANFNYELRLLSNPDMPVQTNTFNENILQLIDGLKIGMPLMSTGTTATFYIPSGLAYGSSTQDGIPANSNLIFKIKLNSFAR